MSIQIIPAHQIDFTTFVDTFNAAYVDYPIPMVLDLARMQRIISRHDIRLNISTVAMDGDQVVGLGMLAQRRDEGWIGGLGVLPDYRRQGIARRMMQQMLLNGEQQGIKRIRLEVIRGNTGAYLLYKSLGFQVLRQLFLVEGKPDQLQPDANTPRIEVRSVAAHEALAYYHTFHQHENPWQRELPVLRSLGDEMSSLIALRGGQVSAYAAGWFHRDVIRWMDMGQAPDEAQALQAIVAYVHRQNRSASGSLINLGENDPAWSTLASMGYQASVTQFEMALTLPASATE